MQIRPVGAQFYHTHRRTDSRTGRCRDKMKLVAFAIAHKNMHVSLCLVIRLYSIRSQISALKDSEMLASRIGLAREINTITTDCGEGWIYYFLQFTRFDKHGS